MKAAIVTGGARGIGRAITFDLIKRGIKHLTVTARTEGKLFETREVLVKAGAGVLAFKADVRNLKTMEVVVSKSVRMFGQIDVLINNAGVAQRKLFIQTKPKDWDEIIDVNLKGIFVCTSLVLPQMLARKEGIVINIASGAGKAGFTEFSIYCASNFGVVGFSESLAKEVGNYGIKVYAICPGGTDTRMYRSLLPGKKPMYKPERVAHVVGKLISGEISIPSGHCIDVY